MVDVFRIALTEPMVDNNWVCVSEAMVDNDLARIDEDMFLLVIQWLVIVGFFGVNHCPDFSVVHASGTGRLLANPHVACQWLFTWKSTRMAVITMGSNDLVVGEDHLVGANCQRHNWQMGRWGLIAFGSSPTSGRTLISNPAALWKRLQEITSRKTQEWNP